MALSMTTDAARAAQAKAAKYCEQWRAESSLAAIAREILDDFDTRRDRLEYRCLQAAFVKSHGKKDWSIVDDIVREFQWHRG